MSLTIDPMTTELDEWTTELSLVDHWAYTMFGIRPQISSPVRSAGPVHPSNLAAACWLTAMWGFSV